MGAIPGSGRSAGGGQGKLLFILVLWPVLLPGESYGQISLVGYSP